ncbi:unnamed protein product [Paramecium pentaurelia]|uniref:Uncharacterized protein n=1 Tax=Paramecium pentaurelia TaxID=43138 RepID=A0A8S1YPX1_9CILI|nr:unnamed protein product [Paramecium pentaurelia]
MRSTNGMNEKKQQMQNTNHIYKRELIDLLLGKCILKILFDYFGYKRELNQEDFRNQEILTIIEQIQFLQWQGQYGPNYKQQVKWIATWKGEIIQEVDGYNENELKLGQLKQPSKNYWRQCIQNSQAQLYESGEYYLDQILGDGIISMITKLWMFINQFISGGESYDYGSGKIKIGYWINSHDRFSNYRQLAHNGKKQVDGILSIDMTTFIHSLKCKKYQLIGDSGRGLYDDGLKIGKWTDLDEGKISNIKVGRWDIEFRSYKNDIQNRNSCGQYDDGNKMGNWIDLDEQFKYLKLVIHNGEYSNCKNFGVVRLV